MQQREETERNQSALISRVEQLSNYKLRADQQVREAQAEALRLRQELARRQEAKAPPRHVLSLDGRSKRSRSGLRSAPDATTRTDLGGTEAGGKAFQLVASKEGSGESRARRR